MYKLPVDKLYVTVHPDDDEAHALWTEISTLPKERILDDPRTFGQWEIPAPTDMSEIHYDQGKALSGGVEVAFGDGSD